MEITDGSFASPEATATQDLHSPKRTGWCTAVVVAVWAGIFLLTGAVALVHSLLSTATPAHLRSPHCLIVRTSSGRVRGTVVQFSINGTQYSTVAFYGIPFARPPGGSRRFMRPESARPWQAVFNATHKRPPCKQTNTRFPRNYVIDASNSTEDCLHVNIWVPGSCVDPAAMRASVFWLYGGSFVHGGNSYDFYDGRFVSALGGVVVAVPNYRVTLFGFLNSGTGDVEGNMGLHDQVLALRWVRENIVRFGGDGGNMALAGQSAGAMSLSLLMASPLWSPHAFRRLYFMSGSMYSPMSGNEGDRARRTFEAIADSVQCRQENATVDAVVRCLQERGAPELLKASKNISLLLMPSREGPLYPGGAMKMGDRDFRHVEVIFTTTRNEGMAFFEMMFPQLQGKKQTDPVDTAKALSGMIGHLNDAYVYLVVELLKASYDITDPDYAGWVNLIGDLLIRCPTEHLASELSTRGAKIYYQVYEPKLSFTTFGGDSATHGEDVPILFGSPYLYPFLATEEEREMSQRMIETLANFAMTGSVPSLMNGSAWPQFSGESGQGVVRLTHDGYDYSSPSHDCAIADLLGDVINSWHSKAAKSARSFIQPEDARRTVGSLLSRFLEHRRA